MPTKLSLGQYIPGDTIVHKMDPRIKIICTLIYMIGIFFVDSLYTYIPILLFLVMVIAVARLNPLLMLRSLKPLLFVVIFTCVLNILVTPGEVVFEFWKFVITREGLIRAAFMAIRIVLLVLGTSILTLTTSSIALTDGIEGVLSPLKIVKFPAHELAMMISIALRFIPTLFEETDKIRKAQMARGADFDTGNILQKAKSLVPLLVPLFLNSFRRADELAVAMVSRCYNGSEGRTRLNPLKLKTSDIVILIFVILFFAGIVVYRYIG